MPNFFVPKVDPENQEAAYREIAASVRAGVPEPGRCICSITWRHDRVVWTATVGEQLRGVETIERGRGRTKTYRDVPRSTNDTVIAIFIGEPFLIVHDNASRTWHCPILAGRPADVVYFD